MARRSGSVPAAADRARLDLADLSPLVWLRQLVASALFYLIMWVAVAVYGPLALLTFPFPFRLRYWFISRWPVFHVWLLRWLCGVNYEVRGREHLPPGPAIVMAKHQSVWETLAFVVLLPPQTWVLKRELIWIPVFGWALALLRPIAINRRSKTSAIQQVIEQGRERLRDGIWVTVFPEGTRVMPGERRRWAQGGAALAARTGYPVVPIAHNAGHYWPRRHFIKRPGTIQVVIGPAIKIEGLDAREIVRRAEEWVERTMEMLEEASR